MSETVSACPLCGSSRQTVFDQRDFRSQPVTNQLCLDCGLVYQSPRMSAPELDAFYQEEYRLLYQGSAGPDPKDLSVQRGRADSLLSFTSPILKSISRHLDIGCSAGLLLQAFSQIYNCDSIGIEPGEAYRQYASAQGLRVYSALNDMSNFGEQRFDLISLAHVLEHIADPAAYLADLRENWLAPNGSLLVEVPNLYCHDSFEVAHLVSYSAQTLTEMLNQAGFEVTALLLHGQPRSRLLPLYVTVLARPAAPGRPLTLRPERAVALKRRAGLLHRRLLTRLFPRQAWLPVRAAEKSLE